MHGSDFKIFYLTGPLKISNLTAQLMIFLTFFTEISGFKLDDLREIIKYIDFFQHCL